MCTRMGGFFRRQFLISSGTFEAATSRLLFDRWEKKSASSKAASMSAVLTKKFYFSTLLRDIFLQGTFSLLFFFYSLLLPLLCLLSSCESSLVYDSYTSILHQLILFLSSLLLFAPTSGRRKSLSSRKKLIPSFLIFPLLLNTSTGFPTIKRGVFK